MRKLSLIVLIICAIALSMNLFAGDDDEKIHALESRIKALENTNVARGTNIASAVSRAEAVQTEFAAVKGAVDSNRHLISSLNGQMQNLYKDLERRVQTMEDQLRMLNDMLKKGHGKASASATKEYLAYQSAVEKMNESDYLGAIAAFQEFIKNYPRSNLASEAQFQTGECYFLARDYQQSIKQFQIFIERNPRSKKVADALVMQGSGFVELGMVEEAKAFFTKVMKDYPKTSASTQAKAKIELLENRGTMTAQNHKTSEPSSMSMDYPAETIEQHRARQRMEMERATPKVAPKPAPKKPKRNYMEF